MNLKLIIFFVVAILTLTYLSVFWQNRKKRIKVKLFTQEIEINLGFLAFGIFIDGIILAAILIWLL